MNEEKKMILDMLKEGKITVEQASDLLEAVGKDKSKNNEESFVDKLSTSFEKIMKKTSETISNFDFDIDLDSVNIPNIYHINSQKTENQTKIDDDVNAIEIDLINGSLDIERAQENHIMVDEKVYFKNKEDQVNDYLNIEVVEDKLIVSVNENYKSLDASANVKLYLGKNIYDSLDINIVNGSVYLSNISGENANVDLVNGSIRIDGLNMKKVDLSSKAGSIKIFKIVDAKEVNIGTQFGSVVIDTNEFNKNIKALIKSSSYSIADKFKNKLQTKDGYQVSTNPEESDLDLDIKSAFGRVSIR
ncbi:DUF4097 family beta strand repeat protein [Anaerococcus vaginalis]|uniref:Uncharacterized protein n=2 Tax=Anaerococcus vaginalis TaxID=33037 RepID=C7HWL6_9FIRM|nr:DUF4097 family beta strand repeat-containing protein [Anaerococcus vaginalis]EEU11798.1 hypothetical protein HMPREF0078_1667 [Anaerococcus vaginalis ATCC 51170]QQB61992.1 DUF4097 family beta strand repeat protein [Anaerococcus vaginalis]